VLLALWTTRCCATTSRPPRRVRLRPRRPSEVEPARRSGEHDRVREPSPPMALIPNDSFPQDQRIHAREYAVDSPHTSHVVHDGGEEEHTHRVLAAPALVPFLYISQLLNSTRLVTVAYIAKLTRLMRSH
jgi:hypothetical protein